MAGYHATAPCFADTDWAGIVGCYDVLLGREPSAVLALHRAVAMAMADRPATALPVLDALVTDPALARSHRSVGTGGPAATPGRAPARRPGTTTARSRWSTLLPM